LRRRRQIDGDKGVERLLHAILEQPEVGLRQIANRVAAAVGDPGIHFDVLNRQRNVGTCGS